jgi:Neuraminidase (sialidase)
MKIYTALTITALLSAPLAVFADADQNAPQKALVENRERIEKQVASLDLELAKFTKTLKDEKVSREEKAALVKKMYAAFMIGFPDDCEDLVQTLSNTRISTVSP